jgi:hypothetical protein
MPSMRRPSLTGWLPALSSVIYRKPAAEAIKAAVVDQTAASKTAMRRGTSGRVALAALVSSLQAILRWVRLVEVRFVFLGSAMPS